MGIYEVTLPGGQVQRVRLGQLALGDYLKFIDVTGGHLVFLGPGGATYSVPTARPHAATAPARGELVLHPVELARAGSG